MSTAALSERVLVGLSAVAGALGVALAAAAAHVAAGPTLETAARFLLFHAPALLGLAAALRLGLMHRPVGLAASGGIALGLALFSGDLACRALLGSALLPLAAPTGGLLLIGGWALVLVAAVVPPIRRHLG
jgi:uncharacterized membrane protein YgdD (TMEM256/DUF423 family)